MTETTVVVIGGGVTGLGILRDLSMRGVPAILLEAKDLGAGTSSRFHGLLHSGGRYAVKDKEAAKECIAENSILRRIAPYCIEAKESMFIRTPEDPEIYEKEWLEACAECGIDTQSLTRDEAIHLEPNLNHDIVVAYKCPGAAIDGFRLLWQTAASAQHYGGIIKTYTEVIGIDVQAGAVSGVRVRDNIMGLEYDIKCDYLINATGPFTGRVSSLAGVEVKMKPSKGSMIVFNHRLCSHILHRLHSSADADIFVPHGSATILGTTSLDSEPEDISTSFDEVKQMLEIGKLTFSNIYKYRILRVFAGTRPLYGGKEEAQGRNASRGFVALDHARDGVKNFMSVCGGKFTTYRLMAEKVCDIVCKQLGNEIACRTAEEPLVEAVPKEMLQRAKTLFPNYKVELAVARLGKNGLEHVLERMEQNPAEKEVICECENVTQAEIQEVAQAETTHNLNDVRRRTRLGMGTCQGTFCTYRSMVALSKTELPWQNDTEAVLEDFLANRWYGIRPVLWGNMLHDIEFMRAIYGSALNLGGKKP